MTKWRLLVSGRVQGAGYRALVKNVALELGIKGTVHNLEDGTVEIYCEADLDSFENFKKEIDIKGDPENHFAPHVKKIEVFDKQNPHFGSPSGEVFKNFKIDYGSVNVEIESLERAEIGILALSGVRSDIKNMNTAMNERFDTVDEKYGAISQQMNILTTELQKSTQALVSLTEKIGALIDEKLST